MWTQQGLYLKYTQVCQLLLADGVGLHWANNYLHVLRELSFIPYHAKIASIMFALLTFTGRAGEKWFYVGTHPVHPFYNK